MNIKGKGFLLSWAKVAYISKFNFLFFLENVKSFGKKFDLKAYASMKMKIYINEYMYGHMIKMAAASIYGNTIEKSSSAELLRFLGKF